MTTSVKMKKVGEIDVTYVVTHHGPKTQLEFDLALSWSAHKDGLEWIVDWPQTVSAAGKTPKEAVARMAGWLRRASLALEDLADHMPHEPIEQGGNITLPVSVFVKEKEQSP